MDASQYKDYILTLLFVKYVSDKQKSDPDSLIEVPEGGSFDDMVALKGDKEIGDKINKIIARLAEANELEKVIDQADFNDEEKLGKGKEMQDRLAKLVAIFADLDFRGSRAEGDDLLGDAYEYLMRHFATESGKSKGQFYTPAEVSRIMAKVVGIDADTRRDQTVFDPACGSGSLLLKAAAEAPRGMTIYGQEKDNATWALARMNMILHGNEIADIEKGDTISSPGFTQGGELRTFDFVVMNPPFSLKSWTNGLENDYGRFEFGRPPAKNGDYVFLLHALKSLKSTGKAAVIMPHGVLFRGQAEAAIRKELLRRGYIKAVIGLPPNLFYGTGIPACIVVLDKENAQARGGVFMIDASQGFIKDGAKNRLRSQDIHRIVDTFTNRADVPRYSRNVSLSEIEDHKNDFNLNLPRYIDSSEPEDIQDLHAHLRGGIPERDIEALSRYWDALPKLRSRIFKPSRPGYLELAIDVSEVQQAVLGSPELREFAAAACRLTSEWFAAHRSTLAAITEHTEPNGLIADIGEDLLGRFRPMPLLDEYAVYEQLMAYWGSVMHDDCYLIMHEAWIGAARPRLAIDDKDRKLSEEPDLVIGSGRNANKYKMDLIPPTRVIARYFADENLAVDALHARAEDTAQMVAEFVEERSGEEGILAEAMDGDRITKTLAVARLREIKRDQEPDLTEIAALERLIELYAVEATAKKAAKNAQSALNRDTLAKYGELTGEDVQELVLDDKWSGTIRDRIDGEVDALALRLVTRIKELGERYAKTVEEIDAELEQVEEIVTGHLAEMGVTSDPH
jgi:type I restriction enzyme M protein